MRVIIILCFFMCTGQFCKNVNKDKNMRGNFYSKTNASWDAIRIPMIRPYQLLKLNGSDEWTMNLEETPASISNIKEVNVLKNIAIIHSG